MRRMLWAGLLALPMMLATTETASAQWCGGGCATPGVWGAPKSNPFGCGLFCFRLFPGLHQEGPLVNYGPYYGYYPFEPYGPWTSDLRYTGPTSKGYAHCGLLGRGGGCGHSGCGLHLFGWLHRERGCGSGLNLWHSLVSRLHPGCRSGCGVAASGCNTGCINER